MTMLSRALNVGLSLSLRSLHREFDWDNCDIYRQSTTNYRTFFPASNQLSFHSVFDGIANADRITQHMKTNVIHLVDVENIQFRNILIASRVELPRNTVDWNRLSHVTNQIQFKCIAIHARLVNTKFQFQQRIDWTGEGRRQELEQLKISGHKYALQHPTTAWQIVNSIELRLNCEEVSRVMRPNIRWKKK